MSLVYQTAVASLCAQVFFGGITAVGLIAGDDKDGELRPIFVLELVSQVIEFVWYAVVVVFYAEIVTWTRYIDWFVSTPVMLVSTILFLQHRAGDDDNPIGHARLWLVLALNWCMLSFGFVYEMGACPMIVAIGLGSGCLVASFAFMSAYWDATDALSGLLLWIMFGVWALYGIAATQPHVRKNVAYNALDIVSKNFYGVFLTVYAFA